MDHLPQPDLILVAPRLAGQDVGPCPNAKHEQVTRCPWWEKHSNGDKHPSCRLSPEKGTFYYDVLLKGRGRPRSCPAPFSPTGLGHEAFHPSPRLPGLLRQQGFYAARQEEILVIAARKGEEGLLP